MAERRARAAWPYPILGFSSASSEGKQKFFSGFSAVKISRCTNRKGRGIFGN